MNEFSRVSIAAAILVATHTQADALSLIQEYPAIEPAAILTDTDSYFYVVGERQVWRYDGGFKLHVRLPEKDNQYVLTTPNIRIGRQGDVFAVSTGSYTQTVTYTVGKNTQTQTTTFSRLYLMHCRMSCSIRTLEDWKLLENHYVTTPQGDVLTVFYREKSILSNPGVSSENRREYLYFLNGQPTDEQTYRRLYSDAFAADLYVDDDDGFVFDEQSIKEGVAHRVRGTRSVVWDNERQPHVFFHDPGTRAMHHHYFSRNSHKLIHRDVDSMEAGVENAVFAENDHLWTLHYFYRDNFSKGVAATLMNNDGAIKEQFVVDAGTDINTGWDLRATRAPNGKVMLTYRTDSQNGARRYWFLESADELRELAKRLRAYGTVTQAAGEATDDQAEIGRQLTEGLYKPFKWYALSLGTGVQYAFWNYKFSGPLDYDLDNSLVNLVEVGGQLRGFNFGVEYAKHLVEMGQPTTNASRLSSYFSWNRLLFDFDFKLGLEKSATDVRVKQDTLIVRKYKQYFRAVNLTLLTPRQRSFGIRYQQFNQYKIITKQHIDAGSKQWNDIASGFGEVEVQTFGLQAGYSTVDYLLKFETASRQFYGDFSGEIGLVYERYKGNDISPWGAMPSLTVQPMIGGMAEMGYLWYRRWNTHLNIGGLVKIAYRLNFNFYPSGAKDEENNEVDSSDTNYFTSGGMIFRHGPLVFGSVIF